MADVFISYHVESADRDVKKIADALDQRGISCWYCQKDIPGGESFPGQATKAIKESDVFLLVLDQDSVNSDHVLNELTIALGERKNGLAIIPFKREAYRKNDDIQYLLKRVQIVGDVNDPMDERIEKLIEQVQPHVKKKEAPPEPNSVPAAQTPQQEAAGWNLNGAVEVVDREAVEAARDACTEKDVLSFYRVSGNFGVNLRTLAAGRDVQRKDAAESVANLLKHGPVLITGKGGMGKTVLMLRAAIQWAESGGIAVWVRLDSLPVSGGVQAMVDSLHQWKEAGRRVLVCLENPARGRKGLDVLREAWLNRGLEAGRPSPQGGYVQLLLSERNARLAELTRQWDSLRDWFDGASMAELRRGTEPDRPFRFNGYQAELVKEQTNFREDILEALAHALIQRGIINPVEWERVRKEIQGWYGKTYINLVEMLYQTIFALKQTAHRDIDILLDWEEWGRALRDRTGVDKQAEDTSLYGGIAALSLFDLPMPVSLLCRQFPGLRERDLTNLLRSRQVFDSVEPVIYSGGDRYAAVGRGMGAGPDGGTLRPKHDVIADLFFLFQKEYDRGEPHESPLDTCVLDALEAMNEPEVEALLRNMVDQKAMRELTARDIGRVSYRLYMKCLYYRVLDGTLRLSDHGRTCLCLVLLRNKGGNRITDWDEELHEMLTDAAPEPDGRALSSSLYTEWGIWLAGNGRNKDAEEKFQKVREASPRNLQARTELGRVLAKQGKYEEAAQILREIIRLAPRDLQSRTELGRVLAKQEKYEEAEQVLREVIRMYPTNLPPKMELGKLMERMGKPEGAKALYKEILALDEGNWRALDRLKKMKDV
ncbi:MAG: TIR domain-containing protein [Oscillibacter sp.]|nr:TIR domain-containing protein [Oscillibacter sp.]